MTRLAVRLLGGYRVELDGEPVYYFETDKARALLAYLVVEADRPHRRETLATLLWPERPDDAARKSLRETLFRVRRALVDREPPFIFFATPTDIQFNAASDYTLDVLALEAIARRAVSGHAVSGHAVSGRSVSGHGVSHSPGGHTELLPEALCADFLAGFTVADSEAFQTWALGRQEHYHRLALEILDEQNATFEAAGDYDGAVAAARLQLRMEPWLEEAHRRCMRGLALAGRRDEALRQYEACCRSLDAELGVQPAASTQALYADIRDGRLVAPAKGENKTRPVSLAVSQPSAAQPPARLPLASGAGARLSLLVAREDELGHLDRHLAAALAGETGVAFVSGDPGSGKTALLEAFAASAMAKLPDLLVADARCTPRGHTDPLAPLRRLMEMLSGAGASDVGWRLAGPEQAGRLRDAAGLVLASVREFGPDLAGTLLPAAPTTQGARSSGLSQPLSQGALFDQLTRTLAAIARERPLLLLLDDLHWVDDAAAAFLLHLSRELSSSRLLVLGAYRSTAVSLGRRDPRSGEVSRHPMLEVLNELRQCKGEIIVELDRADGRAFVEAMVDTEPNRLGARFRDALYAQTSGHALFTVETLRNLQSREQLFKDEAGRWVPHESLDWGKLPVRVESAIAERIDRLPEREHRILSAASVQGDDFSGEMVAELTRLPLGDVIAALSGNLARQHALVKAEGVVRAEGLQRASAEPRVGAAQRSIYRFTHHLFQKYVYDALDPVERGQLHAGVAASLDRQAGDDPAQRERISAQLAWHYEAGGLPLQAARALLDAGREAMRLFAHRDALARYEHGLALLAGEPRSKERNEIEQLLEVARLVPQRNLDGMGSAGVQRRLLRARKAFAAFTGEPFDGEASTGNIEGRAKRLMLLAEVEGMIGAGELEDALTAVERLRADAEQCGDEDLLAIALFLLGMDLHHLGRCVESDARLNSAVRLGMQERLAGASGVTGYSVVPAGLGYSALNLWLLGYPDKAVARSAEAIGRAVEAGDRFGQVLAVVTGAILHFLLRDDDGFVECCQRGHRISVECGFGWWRAFFDVLLGRLPIRAAPGDAGIEQMRRGIAEWHGLGMVTASDLLMLVYADGCMAAAEMCPDSTRRGELLGSTLATLDTALDPAKLASGQLYEAEMLRLRGELLLARDGPDAADAALACFRQAMELGREQGALAWELRAAMSPVRLRERQGEAFVAELAEARRCLAGVYGRFTEGFAFPDLWDAAALIGETG